MKYIAYYRVSTKRQGISGLGLEAQKDAVHKYISPENIFMEFTEVETGTSKRHRPILKEALSLCKKNDAVLLIAKLDRLARNVSFVSSLMDSKVKFKAVDFPEANELTIHILSAIAQHEAQTISKRIKEALAVKKQKGELMGTPENLTYKARLKGVETIKKNALENENNSKALAYIKKSLNGSYTLQGIANELNSAQFKTSKGKEFSPMQVKRLIDKLNLPSNKEKKYNDVENKLRAYFDKPLTDTRITDSNI
jgi:DNA invertase Pin-like site-specific DNA recombinase